MRVGRRAFAAGLFLVLFVVGKPVRSQSPDSGAGQPDEWLIGMSLGVPGFGSTVYPDFFTVGLQFTEVNASHIGADLAIGTMPFVFQNGIIPLGLRADITVPLVSPHLIILPAAGTSIIGAAGAGGLLGLNAGIAAVVHSSGMGVRAGVSYHMFAGLNRPIWLAELGFVAIGADPP